MPWAAIFMFSIFEKKNQTLLNTLLPSLLLFQASSTASVNLWFSITFKIDGLPDIICILKVQNYILISFFPFKYFLAFFIMNFWKAMFLFCHWPLRYNNHENPIFITCYRFLGLVIICASSMPIQYNNPML